MTTASAVSTIQVNGTRLHYVMQGQGGPVVFVHGSVNDYRSWTRQAEALAAHYRTVTYSRRYHWPNTPPRQDDPFSIAQHVADLESFTGALGVAPAHVVGSSYGAMIALTFAVHHPTRIRSLVLGEPPLLPWLTGVPGGGVMLEDFMVNAFQPAGKLLAEGDAEGGIRTFIDGVIGPGAFDRLPPVAQRMMLDNAAVEQMEIETPPEQYFPALTPDDVARLEMPVLLIEGALSPPMFGLITDELARALPRAQRVTIPAASHGMHGQNPAAYNDAVLEFLRGSRDSSPG